MKTLVSLAGMGVTGVAIYAAWQLCADSIPYWWAFLVAGAMGFIISAAVALAPPNDPQTEEEI